MHRMVERAFKARFSGVWMKPNGIRRMKVPNTRRDEERPGLTRHISIHFNIVGERSVHSTGSAQQFLHQWKKLMLGAINELKPGDGPEDAFAWLAGDGLLHSEQTSIWTPVPHWHLMERALVTIAELQELGRHLKGQIFQCKGLNFVANHLLIKLFLYAVLWGVKQTNTQRNFSAIKAVSETLSPLTAWHNPDVL